MKILYTFCFIVVFLSINSCGGETQTQEENSVDNVENTNSAKKNTNLNISVLLDLSDRIDPKTNPNSTMDFYKRDIGYVNSITTAFQHHLLNKKLNLMNDKIQLYIDPAPASAEINNLLKRLKVHLTKTNATKNLIDSLPVIYDETLEYIYPNAINAIPFPGSDIWGFMKEKAFDYCVSSNHRNILIIFTDGYIYHKNNAFSENSRSSFLTPGLISQKKLNKANWRETIEQQDFGFITCRHDLNDLEVLVLGINPSRNNPYETDVINAYLEKWFIEMGIKKYAIKSADFPSNLNAVIQNFILTP